MRLIIKNSFTKLAVLLVVGTATLLIAVNNDLDKKIGNWLYVANKEADVPPEINSQVAAELNLFTKERDLKKIDVISSDHFTVIKTVLKQNKIPTSFLGIPFIETRFKNSPGKKNAGVWNFSVYTAQMYGLTVDDKMDERLDVIKSSQVAAKYLATLYEIFKNWHLVVLAYRYGEGAILQKVRDFPSATAWEIEEKIENQENYLSRFIAAVIFLESNSYE